SASCTGSAARPWCTVSPMITIAASWSRSMPETGTQVVCGCRRVTCPNVWSGGEHVTFRRIALRREHLNDLPSFPAADKKRDPRYKWFVENYGKRCWEIDALDPNTLRDCVEKEIKALIEPKAWRRCTVVNEAERESLRMVLERWSGEAAE